MAGKYYAVYAGRVPGIYTSWDACRAQVIGYKNAVYKSFQSEEEAKSFMTQCGNSGSSKTGTVEAFAQKPTKDTVIAYVDGSFDTSQMDAFSYGMVVLTVDGEIQKSKKIVNREWAGMRNVAGEICGAKAAMQYAIDKGYRKVIIYHDYEGIAKWCQGIWKTNKEQTKSYKEFYEACREQIEIEFVKVTGHSGDHYNDCADLLAKKALGICVDDICKL